MSSPEVKRPRLDQDRESEGNTCEPAPSKEQAGYEHSPCSTGSATPTRHSGTPLFTTEQGPVESTLPKCEDMIIAAAKRVFEGLGSQVTEERKVIQMEIERSLQQIWEALVARKQDLIGQLEQVTQQKMKNLAAQLERAETQLRSSYGFLQETVQTEEGREVLVEQMKELSRTLALSDQGVLKYTHNYPELVGACRRFGAVYCQQVCPEKCYVSNPEVGVAEIEEMFAVSILTMDQEGRPYPRTLQNMWSELVPSNGSALLVSDVKRVVGNRYEVSYQPQVRGLHHLHIRVDGKHISGSPFSVMVYPKECMAIEPRKADGMDIAVNNAIDISVDSNGDAIVASHHGELSRTCISIFSANRWELSSFTLNFSITCIGVDSQGNTYACCRDRVLKISSYDGKVAMDVQVRVFKNPSSIAVHPHTGKLYVADEDGDCVWILDMTCLSVIGECGSENGQFNSPCGVTFDSSGNLYVADRGNHRIQVFTKDDKYLRQFGKEGEEGGELSGPCAVAVDAVDTVYVAEDWKERISLFAKDGSFLRSFKVNHKPCGIAVNRNGLAYVLFDNRVKVF